ncbi:hypothetical protein DFH08DRAFT_100018 [Mycena albidolilacea]|uniref:C2H2-type domain-containing protein n=1 Tax=Mycena albidolilacea TaxID=1033008 RepID=A0AAD7A8P8_9AGAR|nr:hypothetical protein DFH08DRAFT_100018 [Mycena albidolilacea]
MFSPSIYASSSSPYVYYPPAPVVLPSIHELFPEHLSRSSSSSFSSPPPEPSINHALPPLRSLPLPISLLCSPLPAASGAGPMHSNSYSFDVLKTNPCSDSLEHIASSQPSRTPTPPPPPQQQRRRRAPRVIRPRLQPSSRSSSGSDGEDVQAETEDCTEDTGSEGPEGDKRHVCETCGKRFNRPISLKTHRNTHTGATPFLCPYPNCGRAFNVKSNMHRHFRNHASSPAPSAFIAMHPRLDRQPHAHAPRPWSVSAFNAFAPLTLPPLHAQNMT